MDNINRLKARRDVLLGQFNRLKDFRPGNLLQVSRKCGSPSCHCARPEDPGHPGWQLTRKVRNRTVTRSIPVHLLEQARRQVEEHQRFQQLVGELTEVSESLCDARVQERRKKKL